MQLFLLVAGLVLLLVSPPLFAGAATVGWIFIGVFAAITLIQITIWLLAIWGISKASKSRSTSPFRVR